MDQLFNGAMYDDQVRVRVGYKQWKMVGGGVLASHY